MEELFKTLPQHSCGWSKGQSIFYKHQGFWSPRDFHEGVISAQKTFKAWPNDVLLCTYPKSGTTWLKALSFAIITREKYNESTSPLLTTLPHECVLTMEDEFEKIGENRNKSCFPLVATHIPYPCLPESVITSNCKIVYMYRNLKDVIVSYYHFLRKILKLSVEDAPFDVTCEEFYQGITGFGPYWDHILGYWKASQERPESILFLTYEDMKTDASSQVKKLADFIGYPFTKEEENAGVIESIIKLCSFQNLKDLEVNKSGKMHVAIENRFYFRKGIDGDWKNYFTDEWKEKFDKLIDEKLIDTNIVLK